MLLRVDSAGAAHELIDWAREGIRFSVGFDLTEAVREAILTDQEGTDIAPIERRHRARARVEDQIADSKDTGMAKLPFSDFAMNAVRLELVLIAHDLLVWSKALLLSGELARSRPKRLRHRLLHVAARRAFSGRRAKLRLQASWPWAAELATAFARLRGLPASAG